KLLLVLVMTLSGCETKTEIQCFPQRISIKGDAGATSINSDYKYMGDTLDHIVWSNYQTHTYLYNSSNQLVRVSKKNVQTFKKHEFELIYKDGLVDRRDEYLMELDRLLQEDLDTTFVGYVEYEYNGIDVVAEKVYSLNEEDGEIAIQFYKEYEYDLYGNISSYVCFDGIEGDTVDAFTYKYDTNNNPYSSIKMLFEGESYVNNIIESYDVVNDLLYKHTMAYSTTNFPEQIIIKQGSINYEITSISYTCK
nr:hypothetical protein [Bacteroidales bacterium]